MMTSSVAHLLNGTYTARIQDAVGSSGARVTIGPKASSVQIDGTPTGEGLKLRAARVNSGDMSRANAVPRAQDSINLSPQAKAALAQQKIALQVILAAASEKPGPTNPRQSGPEAVAPTSTAVASRGKSGESADAVDPTDLVSLAQEDPTQVIKDAVDAAQTAIAQISTKEGFIAAVSGDPAVLKYFADGLEDGAKADFLAAVQNGKLDFESVNVNQSMYYTGTGMGGHSDGGPLTVGFDMTGKHAFTFGLDNLGFINIGWPKT